MSCKDFSCANDQITIGLDIGIASVGWAVLRAHKEVDGAPNGKIVDLGVRIFEAAEDKRGKPLNISRREARLTRKRLTKGEQEG